jgi:hypothetical protein
MVSLGLLATADWVERRRALRRKEPLAGAEELTRPLRP